MGMASIASAEEAALVVIDLQEKLLPHISGAEQVVANSRRLILAAKELQLPIIYSEQYPKGLGATVPAILDALKEAQAGGAQVTRVEKTTFSCTGCEAFMDALDELDREQFLLCGVETHVCVCQTALGLLDEGGAVFVAGDAVGSRVEANRLLALERLRFADVIVAPTESLLFEMLGDAKHQSFKAVSALVK